MSLKSLLCYIGNRHFEWVMALSILSIGIWAMIFSVATGGFRPLLQVVDQTTLCIIFMSVGWFRVVALIANGQWHTWGPRIRACGAACGAVIWSQMCIALLIYCFDNGSPPPMTIPFYFWLALGEIFSCYRVLAGNAHGPG